MQKRIEVRGSVQVDLFEMGEYLRPLNVDKQKEKAEEGIQELLTETASN